MADFSRSDVGDAVDGLVGALAVVAALDVSGCDSGDVDGLVLVARRGQRVLDGLLIRLGAVAERLAGDSGGRGPHGVFLGDGRAVSGRQARREAARARICGELDLVGGALAQGVIGAAQVDLFAQAARDLGPEMQPELNDPALVAAASSQPVDLFRRHLRRTVEQIQGDHGLADAKAKRERSSWRSWFDHGSGMGHVHGVFDPERFESIQNAVDSQLTKLANQGGVSKNANLAAAAAHELLTGAGARHSAMPHIGVIIDWETFTTDSHEQSVRETAGGRPLPPESVARLACDAVVQRIVLDRNGLPLNVGRRYRTATDAQWLATRSMYRSCAWHGCERPLAWCQLHHIHEWEHGGSTDLCNLVPLCTEHHHLVHEGGWSLTMWDDRRLDLHQPDGTRWATTYPGRSVDGAPRPQRPAPTSSSAGARVAARTHRNRRREPATPAGP